jgi:starch phosphorylase
VQEEGLSFEEAVEAVRASTIFTTHTPVPAGNDAFSFELVERYFYNYWPRLGIGRDAFLSLARHDMPWGPRFSMTVLALRLSGRANGVSELHGQVSRDMWKELWPGTPASEVPITHITNGVHYQSWIDPTMEALLDNHLPAGWRERIDDPAVWEQARNIPDEPLAAARQQMRRALVEFARERITTHYHRLGLGPAAVREAEKLLDPNALTIGFARRFATYKRATLIFRDLERLKRILTDPERPVQLLFSGKAHPADEPGKAFIQRIWQFSQNDPDLRGRVLFIEDYDMNVARHLVGGVDIWLNNPRRPLEASGTSGEKAAMNGVPNFSVLDGWWREGWNGRNGWAIGEEREFEDTDVQDEADALSLYATLEDEIIPLYYGKEQGGYTHKWLDVVRESIVTITPRFNMQRMVKDYTNKLYVPAEESGQHIGEGAYRQARELAQWKARIGDHWHGVRIQAEPLTQEHVTVGEPLDLTALVHLNGISPDDVEVQIVMGSEEEGELHTLATHPMSAREQLGDSTYRYEGQFTPDRSGRQGYGVRVLPANPNLTNPMEMGKIRWA